MVHSVKNKIVLSCASSKTSWGWAVHWCTDLRIANPRINFKHPLVIEIRESTVANLNASKHCKDEYRLQWSSVGG